MTIPALDDDPFASDLFFAFEDWGRDLMTQRDPMLWHPIATVLLRDRLFLQTLGRPAIHIETDGEGATHAEGREALLSLPAAWEFRIGFTLAHLREDVLRAGVDAALAALAAHGLPLWKEMRPVFSAAPLRPAPGADFAIWQRARIQVRAPQQTPFTKAA